MAIDIKGTLAKPANAAKFTAAFIAAYASPAFGAHSKSEIDLLVFSCLIEAGAIDPEAPEYDIARALNITPARVCTLILNWQLRSMPAQSDLRAAIIEALKKTRFSNDGKLLTFGVESPLLKEEITARLKRKGVFPDASFSKELVKLPADAFVEFLDEIVDDETKKQGRRERSREGPSARSDRCGFSAAPRLRHAHDQGIDIEAPMITARYRSRSPRRCPDLRRRPRITPAVSVRGRASFPVLGNSFPCFLAQNSLFHCLGKHGQRGRNAETLSNADVGDGPCLANFLYFSL